MILSKLGINVSSYEPDGKHFLMLKKNIIKNNCKNIKPYKLAMWSKKKKIIFNRVMGNTTGSHINDAKEKPYGKIIKIKIKTENFNNIVDKFNVIKIDCEGSEKEIFKNVDLKKLENVDCILEISDKSSRKIIWEKLKKSKLKIYSQKIGWKQSKKIYDLPKNYKEGNIFISKQNKFD